MDFNNINASLGDEKKNYLKKNFTTVLPPPNITGSLHIGHFFNWTIQDLLVRKSHIDGFGTKWLTGIDHAGIGAQFVLERFLEKEGKSRNDMDQAEFLSHMYKWKETSEGLITNQAEKLGFFMDWEKRRFTMDEEYQKSVTEAFCRFYEAGLIKKKERLTSWDAKFQTALSDLEVVEKIENRKIYTIEYFGPHGSIKVATTRPETMFGDMAIAVHPDDERFKEMHGKSFEIPLTGRQIPLIKDELCDMEKGTGAVKITPAHDALDYEIATKHEIDMLQIIDKEGKLFSEYVPEEFRGKSTKEARKMLVEKLRESGQLIEEKDWSGIVYYGEKSDQQIETLPTKQWFLDVNEMAQQALQAKKEGKVKFIPQHIDATFENWMKNIKPWCISRQIWWGHQIPVWYGPDGKEFCARSQEDANAMAKEFYGNEIQLQRENDVLDTWFSSALWPMAIQGWPGEMERFPTDVLVTGYDILFFWVARMMMFSLYLEGEIPFKTVYFNGIIRDGKKQKMSKTKGNVIDPLELAEKYSSDALRLCLLRQCSWGRDISFNERDIESARSFITKISNATRFVKNLNQKDLNLCENSKIMDFWMHENITLAENRISQAISEFAFHEAMDLFDKIFWDKFCDWYIEGLKIYPSQNAYIFLGRILKIGSPFLPETAQNFWQEIKKANEEESIMDCVFKGDHENSPGFEDIILATKILRRFKKLGDIKDFTLENSSKEQEILIRGYTKMGICENPEISIQAGAIKVYFEKEQAKQCIEPIKNQLQDYNIQKDALKIKIENAKNVPNDILREWNRRWQSLSSECIMLEEWLKILG